jgi:putative flippase GtrA
MKLNREVALFGIGGLLGLIVDAGTTQALVSFAHINPLLSKAIAFVPAATVTWWWNRSHTFAARQSGRPLLAEWAHWLVLMSGGWVVNYLCYWGLLSAFSSLAKWPGLAAGISSLIAAAVNFLSARTLLFRRSKTNS